MRGSPAAQGVVAAVRERLGRLDPWTPEALSATVRETGREIGVKGPGLFHPIRSLVTGDESGPDLGGILAALGREEVLRRLGAALDGTPAADENVLNA